MKQVSTLFLKVVVILLAAALLALCGIMLYSAATGDVGGYNIILLGMCVSALPVFFALYQTWKLLSYVDRNNAFSQLSVTALKNIKRSSLAVSLLYGLGLPYVFVVADRDDAPGAILIAFAFAGAALVFAVVAAVLQTLLQQAIDIKKENDLTV